MTASKRNNMASKLITLMQTNSANMSPQIAAIHYMKIAKLWGHYDLVDMIKDDMNREPTEQEKWQQQYEMTMAELALKEKQIELLKLAKELELDDATILKAKATAESALAQADKLHAQKQLFDQEFNLIESGTKREQEKEDREYQHLANLEREKVRTEREQKNIELKKQQDSKDRNLEYIKKGTLHNSTYDPVDDVFRNILTKNSLDTSGYNGEQYLKSKKESKGNAINI